MSSSVIGLRNTLTAGYRKELNVLPEGWHISNLDSCMTLLTDFEANGSFASVKENVTIYDVKNYAWYVRATDLEKNSPLTKVKYVDQHSYDFLTKTRLSGNEVLVTKRGEIGKVYYFKPVSILATLAPNLYLLKLNESVNSKFIYYTFVSDVGRAKLVRINASTTMGALYKNDVKNLLLTLPPLPEQQKIAQILTSIDNVIEKTQAQIDKLKDLKTAMMQELLTKGIGHLEFKESPVGRIPVGWEVVELENLVNTDKNITYGIVQAGPHCDGGIPYIRVSDMNSRHLNREGMLLTSPAIAEKFKRSAVSTGDIVYALRGMIGHVHMVPSQLDGANLTQGTARISPCQTINSNYLLWAMKSPYVAVQNDLEAKGSTFREVTLASLRKIKVCVPTIDEQQKIVSVLEGIDEKTFAVQDKLTLIKSIKKALMQDLLTGKVRVCVNE
jgi:type I restriction enzyme S subunit